MYTDDRETMRVTGLGLQSVPMASPPPPSPDAENLEGRWTTVFLVALLMTSLRWAHWPNVALVIQPDNLQVAHRRQPAS